MHSRPIGELTAALERLGVAVRFENEAGYPPFILKTRGLEGGSLEIGLGRIQPVPFRAAAGRAAGKIPGDH